MALEIVFTGKKTYTREVLYSVYTNNAALEECLKPFVKPSYKDAGELMEDVVRFLNKNASANLPLSAKFEGIPKLLEGGIERILGWYNMSGKNTAKPI